MFFGRFLDGPLQGSTFEMVECGDDGGLLGGIGSLFVISTVLAVVMILIVGPFIIWPIFFQEMAAQKAVGIAYALTGLQFVYCVLRIRHNIRRWRVSVIKELLLNMLFLLVVYLTGVVIAFWILLIFFADQEIVQLMIRYAPQLLEQLREYYNVSLFFAGAFLLLLMSGVPVAINCLISRIWINKIAAVARVPRKPVPSPGAYVPRNGR